MGESRRATRGETTLPPAGYEVIRVEGRYFPVRLHLQDPQDPGASAFQRADGSIVSFAKRTSAILYLYQKQRELKIEVEEQYGY
ncbi:MAG TPA: hypothetical protein VFA41_00075 [Ktedonobacteraceae bacterium]|jgi:hypothetical protein|nr:hypothetical protein [Ktedonobacteraceae bacterium]